jgi:hypothetical protein
VLVRKGEEGGAQYGRDLSMYVDFTRGTDAAELHGKLYRGAIVRFRDLASMRELIAFTRAFVEAELAPAAPVESHVGRNDDDLAQVYASARRRFANSAEVKRRWRDVFVEAGLDPEQTAHDRLVLRFAPPAPPEPMPARKRGLGTVHFHRDTWGTNLYAQINWWAPVYPLDPGRTLAFYPHLFDCPLANSSTGFDIADVMQRSREGTLPIAEAIPRLLEPLPHGEGAPVLIEPGEVIAFSAQHAHGGVGNHTGLTRISLETRTLFIPDHAGGRGAPNVDGRARWMTPGMFRRLADGEPLDKLLGVPAFQPYEVAFAGLSPPPPAGES